MICTRIIYTYPPILVLSFTDSVPVGSSQTAQEVRTYCISMNMEIESCIHTVHTHNCLLQCGIKYSTVVQVLYLLYSERAGCTQ